MLCKLRIVLLGLVTQHHRWWSVLLRQQWVILLPLRRLRAREVVADRLFQGAVVGRKHFAVVVVAAEEKWERKGGRDVCS